LPNGTLEFAAFDGSSADMLRYAMQVVGAHWRHPAAGITKLIMSEAHNFPDVTAFTSPR
jgi:TetR/AcrR family transcriptional regulator